MNILAYVSWTTWEIISFEQIPFSYIARDEDMNKLIIMSLCQTVAPNFVKADISFSFPLEMDPNGSVFSLT